MNAETEATRWFLQACGLLLAKNKADVALDKAEEALRVTREALEECERWFAAPATYIRPPYGGMVNGIRAALAQSILKDAARPTCKGGHRADECGGDAVYMDEGEPACEKHSRNAGDGYDVTLLKDAGEGVD